MKALSEIPVSRPRMNKLGQITAGKPRKWGFLSQRRREAQKWAFIDLIRLAYTDEQAAEQLSLPRETPERALARFGRYWKADPEFRQRYHDACEMAGRIAGGILDGGLVMAAEGLVEIAQTAKDPKVRLQAQGMILKGRGLLTEKTEQEIKGLIGVFSADDIAKEFRAAKKRLSEGGG